ncbi:uncharacterized protein LOC127658199 isoform X1 [Xyrauchen texanus]|uniref:uncharacterized protein LOC127658199 isoform X1 n=1 Tax=Xyrauchen texanus TaxID=154827 RepID=UPI0022427CAB|nr:uncharacterized protein LOC127658199 isoform X1 [Xyrauchen texanus]
MNNEPEAEVSDVTSATVQNPSMSDSAEAGTLLEVTYQRNPKQKYKYLEAEPKILGVTEIVLTVFFLGCKIPFYMEADNWFILSAIVAFSSISIIGGSVAIAAQKLHLPTLKACLGMQIVMCVVYGIFLITTTFQDYRTPVENECWPYISHEIYNETSNTCRLLMGGFQHLYLLDQLMEAVQIAISVTLAAYCCKVIQSCSASSHVPVIFMKSPTAPH